MGHHHHHNNSGTLLLLSLLATIFAAIAIPSAYSAGLARPGPRRFANQCRSVLLMVANNNPMAFRWEMTVLLPQPAPRPPGQSTIPIIKRTKSPPSSPLIPLTHAAPSSSFSLSSSSTQQRYPFLVCVIPTHTGEKFIWTICCCVYSQFCCPSCLQYSASEPIYPSSHTIFPAFI